MILILRERERERERERDSQVTYFTDHALFTQMTHETDHVDLLHASSELRTAYST